MTGIIPGQCIDCKNEIQKRSTRCHGCNSRFQRTGNKLTEEHKNKISDSLSGKMPKNINLLLKRAKRLKKEKRYRAPTKTINGKSYQLSHTVYISQEGNHPYIPKGFVIHHYDGNQYNNNTDNLIMMPHGLHSSTHAKLNKEILRNAN